MHAIHKGFKIRAYPTQEQRQLFARTEGACRYVYNRALAELGESYQKKKSGEIEKTKSVIDISRDVTQWKRQAETAWLVDVPSSPVTCALRALDDAFKRFFSGQNKYPKKHRRQMACSIRSSLDPRHKDKAAAWKNRQVLFPGFGVIKLAQPERLTVAQPKILTLSRDACGRYFIAFMVEVEQEPLPANGKTVGVDLGVKTLAVYSTGEKVDAHQAAQKLKRRLKHAQRSLSRKQGARKGEAKSNRYRHQQQRVARIQCRITDARRDTQHKLTDDLTKRFSVICLEDLNVKGMSKSAKGTSETPGKNVAQKAGLNRGIANAGFWEIRRQIEYKAHWRGGAVLFADRWAPTSRTCCECGTYQAEFSLKIRTWTCPGCGVVHDRDENAARNIVTFATGQSRKLRWGTPEVQARGEVTKSDPAGVIQPTCRNLDEPRTDAYDPWSKRIYGRSSRASRNDERRQDRHGFHNKQRQTSQENRHAAACLTNTEPPMCNTPRYNQAPDYSIWSATELCDESKRLQHLTAAVKAEIARRQDPCDPPSSAGTDEHDTWPDFWWVVGT